MSKVAHHIFLGILVGIVVLSLLILVKTGASYYVTPLIERSGDPAHETLKPSGYLGHGYGILGSLLMIIGMLGYMARKRFRWMSRMGQVKYWLEVHIFLCTLGPLLILFHTSFKFGGLVAVSFWSMVAVFTSGIIGRFIYIQIPRTIEGRMLNLNEVRGMKTDVAGIIKESYNLGEESYSQITESLKRKSVAYHSNPVLRYFRNISEDRGSVRSVVKVLRKNKLPKTEYKKLLRLVEDDIALNRKIERLDMMQNLFKYWHVAHLPFAMVMLIVMFIHVGVTILFGYRWIF